MWTTAPVITLDGGRVPCPECLAAVFFFSLCLFFFFFSIFGYCRWWVGKWMNERTEWQQPTPRQNLSFTSIISYPMPKDPFQLLVSHISSFFLGFRTQQLSCSLSFSQPYIVLIVVVRRCCFSWVKMESIYLVFNSKVFYWVWWRVLWPKPRELTGMGGIKALFRRSNFEASTRSQGHLKHCRCGKPWMVGVS